MPFYFISVLFNFAFFKDFIADVNSYSPSRQWAFEQLSPGHYFNQTLPPFSDFQKGGWVWLRETIFILVHTMSYNSWPDTTAKKLTINYWIFQIKFKFVLLVRNWPIGLSNSLTQIASKCLVIFCSESFSSILHMILAFYLCPKCILWQLTDINGTELNYEQFFCHVPGPLSWWTFPLLVGLVTTDDNK